MFKERQVIKDILAVLYREHDYDNDKQECNPDKEWEVDSIEDIARILQENDFIPEHCITMKPEDEITLVWCVDDVIDRANDIGKPVTAEEARSILLATKRSHDCNYGVTWEHFDYHIEETVKARAKHPATVAEIEPTFPEGYQLDGQP